MADDRHQRDPDAGKRFPTETVGSRQPAGRRPPRGRITGEGPIRAAYNRSMARTRDAKVGVRQPGKKLGRYHLSSTGPSDEERSKTTLRKKLGRGAIARFRDRGER